MLKNENIICISSIDWDFIWQGHQEIMSQFARNGNRVLFIENTGVRVPGIRDISRIRHRIKNWFRGIKGIRKEAENIYIFSPLVLPFPYSRIARWINHYLVMSIIEKWMRAMDFSDPVIWTFLPTPLSIDIADSMMKRLVIYYCIDNFYFSSRSAKKIKRSEENLLKKVDIVFTTSKELYNRCSMHNNKVYNFPFAVNFSEFEKTRLRQDAMPDELKDIKAPIIGYVGGVHKWVDQGLLKDVIEEHPDKSFVFVGPLQTDVSQLSRLKNVHFLGKKEHGRVPLFVKYFNACIIPYLITDYTNNVYPTKLNEYLAFGRPVISTVLPEVIAFNKEYGDIVYVVKDKTEFSAKIKEAFNEDNGNLVDKRIEVARGNSWENRIRKMSDLIEREIGKKRIYRETSWQKTLFAFYGMARKRTARLLVSFVLLYLLLFKTFFIWFLAAPLRIDEAPHKADSIVVFGGGVGETGSPGKSTIERSRYAVELYKNGYADKIIFSSGYTYKYNDAENMRLFAISMGVPDRAIILEQKANSTYENVILSKNILEQKDYHSILLVSSLYNMRRAKLVFDKFGKDIKVFYTPVEKSQFYDRAEGLKLEQIRAIAHEYLGIIYYFLKGYI